MFSVSVLLWECKFPVNFSSRVWVKLLFGEIKRDDFLVSSLCRNNVLLQDGPAAVVLCCLLALLSGAALWTAD